MGALPCGDLRYDVRSTNVKNGTNQNKQLKKSNNYDPVKELIGHIKELISEREIKNNTHKNDKENFEKEILKKKNEIIDLHLKLRVLLKGNFNSKKIAFENIDLKNQLKTKNVKGEKENFFKKAIDIKKFEIRNLEENVTKINEKLSLKNFKLTSLEEKFRKYEQTVKNIQIENNNLQSKVRDFDCVRELLKKNILENTSKDETIEKLIKEKLSWEEKSYKNQNEIKSMKHSIIVKNKEIENLKTINKDGIFSTPQTNKINKRKSL